MTSNHVVFLTRKIKQCYKNNGMKVILSTKARKFQILKKPACHAAMDKSSSRAVNYSKINLRLGLDDVGERE